MRSVTTLIPVSLACLLLAGCASSPSGAPEPVSTSPAAAPVTVDNCGFALEVDAPPERIVTVKSTATELLLALGLGDRIIGTAFPDGPVPQQWAGEAEIPLLSEFAPSQEAVLELEPEFVFAGWESVFTPEAAGEREDLAKLGIGTYVAPSACKDPAHQPDSLRFDDVFQDIEEAGRIFGAREAAAALVAEQSALLDDVRADARGLTALWYSSGSDTPYVGAGIGAPQMIMDRLGLRNIAADIEDTWTSLSWEAVVAAEPDVIVLVDASWNTAESKIQRLRGNPATAALDAVRKERYLVIPFAAGEAGVRNVPAVIDLAEQLSAIDVG